MKVLVTGGTGFVGSNLALYFRALGHDVRAVDNFFKQMGAAENLARLRAGGIEVVHVDIRNTNDVTQFFGTAGPTDVVLHAAAQVAFKRSVENPRLDFEINLLGTFNLLEAVRQYVPEAIFLYVSTNQVYGQLNSVPLVERERRLDYQDLAFGIPETFPLEFLSPYGCSKGGAEQYALDYARMYGLRTVVARLGGIYGEWQYSYEDHGWVAFMTKMLLMDEPFNRFGHGKQVRDVLHISDLCRAFELLVEHIDTVQGQALNIAGGPNFTLSVLELLDLLEDLTGRQQKSVMNPMRVGDKLVAYLDTRKAERLIGWSPVVSPREGVGRLISWTQEHLLTAVP